VNISRFELEEKITSREVKTLQIVNIWMVGSVIIFLAVILLLFYKNSSDVASMSDNQYYSQILLISLIVIAILEYSLVYYLPKFQLTTGKLKIRLSSVFYDPKGKIKNEPVFTLLQIYRMLMIIRLAMLDGVAIFGLFVLYYAVSNNLIYSQPIYWISIIPLIIIVLFVYFYFPTKEKIIFYIEKNILDKLRRETIQ